MGTNNSPNQILFQTYNKLQNRVLFIKEINPKCHFVLSFSINRFDDGKAAPTTKRLNSLLLDFSLDISNNSKIGYSFLGMHGLHLNEHSGGKLALNFVKRIRSIFNSGYAKQKWKEVHSKVSRFWRSSYEPRSDKPEAVYLLSHNLNEETVKCKKRSRVLHLQELNECVKFFSKRECK